MNVIHKECGSVAFTIVGECSLKEFPKASAVTLPDGKQPKPFDPTVCGSCGQHFFWGEEQIKLKE